MRLISPPAVCVCVCGFSILGAVVAVGMLLLRCDPIQCYLPPLVWPSAGPKIGSRGLKGAKWELTTRDRKVVCITVFPAATGCRPPLPRAMAPFPGKERAVELGKGTGLVDRMFQRFMVTGPSILSGS